MFDSPARSRILDAFVENSDRQLNVSDVARLSDTSRSTVYDHLEVLTELRIVQPIDEGTTRYTLNEDDEIAVLLDKLQGMMVRRLLDVEQDVEW
ncbi:winged helix-turn-helix domain-containing protein [Halopenitus salinus]|uniref:Winged helix-turn-helix domain-containing protein n=1 Tax=Halopenitus salinus TaxID=1198295 RepID=A0ABD5USY7_9EURY